MDIRDIGKVNSGYQPPFSKQISGEEPKENSFKDMMKEFMSEVNDMKLDVDKKIEDFAAGKIKDLHQMTLAMEKADVAFKLMMEIRNKLLKAYKELIRMPM